MDEVVHPVPGDMECLLVGTEADETEVVPCRIEFWAGNLIVVTKESSENMPDHGLIYPIRQARRCVQSTWDTEYVRYLERAGYVQHDVFLKKGDDRLLSHEQFADAVRELEELCESGRWIRSYDWYQPDEWYCAGEGRLARLLTELYKG